MVLERTATRSFGLPCCANHTPGHLCSGALTVHKPNEHGRADAQRGWIKCCARNIRDLLGHRSCCLRSSRGANCGSDDYGQAGCVQKQCGDSALFGVGAPVVADDLLNTDAQGRTNLRFLDQSTLDIGPGSDVKIDRFVYNPNRTTAGASISLVRASCATTHAGRLTEQCSFERRRARSAFAVLQQLSLIIQPPERRGTRSARASPRSAQRMCRRGQHLRRRRLSARMGRLEIGRGPGARS